MRQLNPVFRARVEGGKLHLEARTAFQALVERLEGKEVDLILRPRRKRRSLRANAYYWTVVVPMIADYMGHARDEYEAVHFALKEKFLRDRERETHGLIWVRSTANLTSGEFADYVDACIRFAALELGVVIPDPGQVA